MLGTFGGVAPALPMAQGGWASAVGEALDRARELQSPSPEGQVLIKEQVKTDEISLRGNLINAAINITLTTDYQDIGEITLITAGGDVFLLAFLDFEERAGATLGNKFGRFTNDGSQTISGEFAIAPTPTGASGTLVATMTLIEFLSAPSSGTHTFKVQAKAHEASSRWVSHKVTFMAFELKR